MTEAAWWPDAVLAAWWPDAVRAGYADAQVSEDDAGLRVEFGGGRSTVLSADASRMVRSIVISALIEAVRHALGVELSSDEARILLKRIADGEQEPGGVVHETVEHLFRGRCPEPDLPSQRDADCPACQSLRA